MIRDACPGDSAAIARIYNHYIARTIITFEEEEISTRAMADRIAEVQADSLPWLAAEVDGQIVGYAYASKWNGRCAYRYSAEATVYLDPECLGRGYGSRLYERLFALLRELGMHTVIGGIALPNSASVALHEKFGMKKVARFEEVGCSRGWVVPASELAEDPMNLERPCRPSLSRARTWRSTCCTAFSTLALSLGLRTRAGNTATSYNLAHSA